MTRRPRALAAAVVLAVLALAGCGSSPTARPSATARPTAGSTPGSDSADQLYAEYLSALRAARSEHYRGTVAFNDGTSVSLEVTATQTTAHLLARTQGVAVEEIVAGGHVYQRGGSPDCGHEPGPVAVSASVDYDSFDSPALITPPPNPTDLNGQTA